MELQEAENLAISLMSEHTLIIQGWTFKFSNKKKSAGTCNYTRKTISLSRFLTPGATPDAVRNTILHEIAHALTPGHGHDFVWLTKAREIGCNGKRCFSMSDQQDEALSKIAPYKGVCKNGHEVYAFRKPKRVSSCSRCCPRFNPEFIISYSANAA